MTRTDILNLIAASKQPEPVVEKLPLADPDDYYVWGEGEFEEVYKQFCDANERDHPAIQFERQPDEHLLDGKNAR